MSSEDVRALLDALASTDPLPVGDTLLGGDPLPGAVPWYLEPGVVAVRPRYLAAGCGADRGADLALGHLLDAGWTGWSDEVANFHTTSSCGRAYLGFLPEPNPEEVGLWKAWGRPDHHGARTWMLTADDYTPYEFIEALTRAWAGAYDPNSPALPGPLAGHHDGEAELLALLRAAHWGTDPRAGRGLTRWTSPDGRAMAELRPEANPADPAHTTRHGHPHWTICAAPQPYRRPLWTMTATTATPALLLAAFLTALTDPAPLTRELHQVHPDLRPHLALTATTAPDQP